MVGPFPKYHQVLGLTLGPRPYILECPLSSLGFTHYKMNLSINRSKGIDRGLFIRRHKIPPTFKE
jgi:hypothetical protein